MPETDDADADVDTTTTATKNNSNNKKNKTSKKDTARAAETPSEVLESETDADAEFARQLDEVDSGEDHRTKGGRGIGFSD
jgi:hypothetical protein